MLAPAEIEDHLRRGLEPREGAFGIDPAFEPVARVGIDPERAARQRDLHVVPEGAFEEDVDRVFGHAGRIAAHDARDAFGAGLVGNHDHAGLERVGSVVKRDKRFAPRRAVDAQGPLHLVGVEDVQRAVLVIGEEVRHIDQRRDGAQPDGAQLVLQPLWAGAVLHAPDHAAREDRAAVGGVGVDADGDGAGEGPGDRHDRLRFQLAQTARREIARDAAHAQRIGAVGGDRDLDHRVDLCGVVVGQPVDETLAHLAAGQFDDAVMFVGQLHLAFRTHHSVAFDAADLADADGGVDARNIDAGLGHDDGDAFAGIGRAADDLRLARVGENLAHAQAVGIRVRFGLENAADGEVGQPRGGVRDLFDLEAQIGQRLGDRVHRGGGVEVILEPGKREFHRDLPGLYGLRVRARHASLAEVVRAEKAAQGFSRRAGAHQASAPPPRPGSAPPPSPPR